MKSSLAYAGLFFLTPICPHPGLMGLWDFADFVPKGRSGGRLNVGAENFLPLRVLML